MTEGMSDPSVEAAATLSGAALVEAAKEAVALDLSENPPFGAVTRALELNRRALLYADDHCESDGSGTCLVHFGRLEDTDGSEGPDVCDLSPLTTP